MATPAKSRLGLEDGQSVLRAMIGLGAAALVFMACRGFLDAAQAGVKEEATAPPLCDAWHQGSGDGQAINLEQIRRGYAQVKERLSGSLRRGMKKEVGQVAVQAYDLGLPACTGPGKRRARPGSMIPKEFRGKTLWFLGLDGEKAPPLPRTLSLDSSVAAFLVRMPGLVALEKASKSLGRPLSLAPRGLAEALGVRCVPALVLISQEGEVEIHENP